MRIGIILTDVFFVSIGLILILVHCLMFAKGM